MTIPGARVRYSSDTAGGVLIGVALSLLAGSASAARLDYTLDAGVEDNDNIAQTADDRIDERYLRAGFGFVLQQDSSAIQADFNGRVEYRDYDSDRVSNGLDGELSGRLNWVAIPERLHFTAEDSLSVQSVDTLAPDSPDNRQQVNVVSLGPTLFFRLGQTLRGQAELRVIDSHAEETDAFNSQRTALALRALKDLDATSLVSFNLQAQRVDFDSDVATRDYDRYEAYLRYARQLANFDLGLEGGYSQLRFLNGDARRSDPLVRGNLTWRASPRSQLDLRGASMISDAASDALGGITPGSTAPDTVLIGNSQVTGSAYRVRRGDLQYQYTGTRVGFTVGPYVERREYLDATQLDEKIRGAQASIAWQLRPRLSIDVYASQENSDFDDADRSDKTRYLGAALEKEWSRHWSTRLEWQRYERTSNLGGQDVTQNTIYLSVAYRNR